MKEIKGFSINIGTKKFITSKYVDDENDFTSAKSEEVLMKKLQLIINSTTAWASDNNSKINLEKI